LGPDYAVIDIEATTFQKGHPYSDRNRLCYLGVRIHASNFLLDCEYSGGPYGEQIRECQRLLDSVTLLVGFNLKFDLGWLKRYGLNFDHCRVWDCQLASFLMGNQSDAYPSLDNVCVAAGIPGKTHDIEERYWSKGIDTREIPKSELEEYLANDLRCTDDLYNWQVRNFPKSKLPLLVLQNEDLLVLLEMESNGTKFNLGRMAEESRKVAGEIERLDVQLRRFVSDWGLFNWSSGDHLSCLLYGGTVAVDYPTAYEHVYKSGPKAGTTIIRNRWQTEVREFPRLYEPIEGSELQKSGYWSTDASTLRQLRGDKTLIDLLLGRADLEKLQTTYLDGYPKLIEKMDWQDGFVHGTFNQCRVVTGRLSADKPNLQNQPGIMNGFIETRMPE
jgi:DNA polymerase I-like protein with 3'-5' exonuclease and polymerase domains